MPPLPSLDMSEHEADNDADAWKVAHQLGQLLRNARHAKGLNIEDVHQGSGVSFKHWGNIERGERKLSGIAKRVDARANTVALIALTLGVKPADLAAVGRPDAAEHLEQLLIQRKADEHEQASEHIAWLRRLRAEAPTFGDFLELVIKMTDGRAAESTVDSTDG